MLHVEGPSFEEGHDEGVNLTRRCFDLVPVDSQENIHDCERNTLVAVYERMVLHQAFEERSRLVNDRVVVARLRASTTRSPRNPETMCTR